MKHASSSLFRAIKHLSAFIVAALLLFYSCQKDPYPWLGDDASKELGANQAKMLFGDNEELLSLINPHYATEPAQKSLTKSSTVKHGDFKVLWDQAVSYKTDFSEVVEVPLQMKSPHFAAGILHYFDREQSRNFSRVDVQSKLVIERITSSNQLQFFVTTYFSDTQEKLDVRTLRYAPVGGSYSGFVFYSTIYGMPLNGYEFNAGSPVLELEERTPQDSLSQGRALFSFRLYAATKSGGGDDGQWRCPFCNFKHDSSERCRTGGGGSGDSDGGGGDGGDWIGGECTLETCVVLGVRPHPKHPKTPISDYCPLCWRLDCGGLCRLPGGGEDGGDGPGGGGGGGGGPDPDPDPKEKNKPKVAICDSNSDLYSQNTSLTYSRFKALAGYTTFVNAVKDNPNGYEYATTLETTDNKTYYTSEVRTSFEKNRVNFQFSDNSIGAVHNHPSKLGPSGGDVCALSDGNIRSEGTFDFLYVYIDGEHDYVLYAYETQKAIVDSTALSGSYNYALSLFLSPDYGYSTKDAVLYARAYSLSACNTGIALLVQDGSLFKQLHAKKDPIYPKTIKNSRCQ